MLSRLSYAISLQYQGKPLSPKLVGNQGNHSVVKTTDLFLQCRDDSKKRNIFSVYIGKISVWGLYTELVFLRFADLLSLLVVTF